MKLNLDHTKKTSKKNTLLFLFILLSFNHLNNPSISQTLELPEIVSGEVLESIKGTTVNTSKNSGATSSLSFGSETRFGTSSSVSGTSSTKASSESIFKVSNTSSSQCSSGGCITTSIGGDDAKVTAKILNIKASNLDSHNETTVDSFDNNYSNGEADISGISAANSISLDGSETIFKARAGTVHSDANYDSIISSTISSDAQTATSSSSGFTTSNTTVDINVSDYVTTFQRAF